MSSNTSKSKKRPIPEFQSPIVETHCHLDYLKEQGINEVLADARSVGVQQVVTISTEPENLRPVLDIALQHERVFCTQGIHPHEAEKYTPDVGVQICDHVKQHSDKVVAIGEIGLDYYYDHADRKVQQQVFERQLEIACELDKPIVVHTRDADEDTQAILANFSSHLKRKGVIHSFTSGLALAEYCLSEGFFLGFNGIITFNKADNVREILAATPIEQMVAETDSPYLTPVPYRGKENGPKYLPFVVEKIAEVKEVPVEQLLPQLYQNSQRLFGLA